MVAVHRSQRVFTVVVIGISLEASLGYEPMTTVQTQLSSCHAVNQFHPGPGTVHWSPSLYILPSVPLTSSHCRRNSRLTKPCPYRNNIYRYFGHRAQSPCNGSSAIDQFRSRMRSSSELQRAHVHYLNTAAIF